MRKALNAIMAAIVGLSCATASANAADDDLFSRAPWYAVGGVNWYQTEGDWEAEPGIGVFG